MKMLHPFVKIALPFVFAALSVLPGTAHAGNGHDNNGHHYGNGNGNGGGGSVPVNSGLILLGIAGVTYIGFKMYTKYKKGSANV